MQEKLLTPDEVSNLLGIQKHTLAVWRSSGRYNLTFTKVGRSIRYRESDVEQFIYNHSGTSTGEIQELIERDGEWDDEEEWDDEDEDEGEWE